MDKVSTVQSIEAWNLVREHPNALFIDTRSLMEHLFVGHPVGCIHIPWIDEPDWTVNPDFVVEVRRAILGGVGGSVPVVLICRSGMRSLEAGQCLVKAGFRNVYNVADGFEGELDEHHHRSAVGGWRFHGLPWEQC